MLQLEVTGAGSLLLCRLCGKQANTRHCEKHQDGGTPGRKEHLVGTGGSGHTLEMVPGLGVTENHFASVSVWTFLAV